MNECGVVQDLLPLYADGAASGDTVKFLSRHLANCSACRNAYRSVKREAEAAVPRVTVEPEDRRFLEIRNRIRRKRTLSLVVFGAVAASAAYFALTDLIHSEQNNRKDA